MKKSLIALAVLAASGAAMAQSSVSVYGVADLWFGSISNKTDGVKNYENNGNGQTGLFDGGVSNSRFGFRGTEDLGGGLKANFALEQGFGLDTGASTSSGFNRQAWVGLSGGFGELQLGKAYNAFDDVSALAASTFDSDLAPINTVFLTTLAAGAFNNTIKYSTPTFGGFTGGLSYSFGEDKTATTDASTNYSLSGKYVAGPLAVGIAYLNAESDLLDLGGEEARATRLAASYDLGVAKLLATYGRGTAKVAGFEGKVTEWEVGADVPLASALTLSLGYARANEREDGVKIAKSSGFGVALAYSLSKRTTVYTGFNETKYEDLAPVSVEKSRIYAVGLKHTF